MSTWADLAALSLCLAYPVALALVCAAWLKAVVVCVRILTRSLIDSLSA